MPTLLVVDDEPAILLAFRRAFRDAEYETITAESAAEGLELARNRRPDVAVLDVQLPDGSGLELFAKLAQSTPEPQSFSSPERALQTPRSRR